MRRRLLPGIRRALLPEPLSRHFGGLNRRQRCRRLSSAGLVAQRTDTQPEAQIMTCTIELGLGSLRQSALVRDSHCGAQSVAGTEQPRPDRAYGDADDRSGFFIGHAFETDQ